MCTRLNPFITLVLVVGSMSSAAAIPWTGRCGLVMYKNGLITITEGTLVLEGDERMKVDGLIAAGQITAYDGPGYLELDFDERKYDHGFALAA
jgi:hypothetical protein